MNEGAAPPGGVGPTEAAAAADADDAQERQEALLQRVDTNAADQVDDGGSLQVAASELKQNAILSGSGAMNVDENIDARAAKFDQLAEDTERLLQRIHEQATASLKELETHYYSSVLWKDAGAGDATDK